MIVFHGRRSLQETNNLTLVETRRIRIGVVDHSIGREYRLKWKERSQDLILYGIEEGVRCAWHVARTAYFNWSL